MTSRDFAYWLQGFFEVANPRVIEPEQVDLIKKHLNLVFYHEIDPSYSNDDKTQQEMNNIHNSGNEAENQQKPPFPTKPPKFDHSTLVRC